MDKKSRMEYFKAVYQRYRKSSKDGKSRILDEFCRTSGLNRKYAIHKFNGPLEPPPRQPSQRGFQYSPEAMVIVLDVWKRAGYPWSKRLKVILEDWAPWIRRRYRPRAEIERQMLSISPRQLDRRLKEHKRRINRRIYGRTKPGKMLKHHIPVRTIHWDVKEPGWVEIDLVSHSGNCASGEFAYSLNLTDIQTGWVETRAVLGKGEEGIVAALEDMAGVLPFRLLGLDSDNGSEFINHHLYKYCQSRKIQFTRGRPYAKQDNAHVEQKNWTHVRRLMGYERYDSVDAVEMMNDLYRGEIRLMMNLFQPSVKLKRKERVGSRLRRKHDAPQTPLDRLQGSKGADLAKIAATKHLKTGLDPFKMSDIIDQKLTRIHGLADRRAWPSNNWKAKQKARLMLHKPRLTELGFKRRDNTALRSGFLMA